MHDEGSFAASIIGSSVKTLAAGIVDRHMSIEAHAADTSYGGQRTLAMDTETRLNHLAEALAAEADANPDGVDGARLEAPRSRCLLLPIDHPERPRAASLPPEPSPHATRPDAPAPLLRQPLPVVDRGRRADAEDGEAEGAAEPASRRPARRRGPHG